MQGHGAWTVTQDVASQAQEAQVPQIERQRSFSTTQECWVRPCPDIDSDRRPLKDVSGGAHPSSVTRSWLYIPTLQGSRDMA